MQVDVQTDSPKIKTYLSEMANAARALSIDMVQKANSGHPGMPLGMASITTVLFRHFLRYNPNNPKWPNRDRFIISNGHGSALLYSTLHLAGYNISMEQLKNFRQLNSCTPGHPEYGATPGVETTTGPLGQGLANAVGMAIAQEKMAATYGRDLFSNYTYVTVGDGCLMEGISHEAAELAGHLKLKNLIILFDDNGITIDGKTELSTSIDMLKRFESYGFAVQSCYGHNDDSIKKAIEKARTEDKPSFIAFKTHIGYGSPNKVDTSDVHGSPLGEKEINLTKKSLNWQYEPFQIPSNIYEMWAKGATEKVLEYNEWLELYKASEHKPVLERIFNDDIPASVSASLGELKHLTSQDKPTAATRKSSHHCLSAIAPLLPELISGSADLTPSNNTKTRDMEDITASNFSGNYIHYGVREHAMAAIMNGLSLYGGFIPVGGTFMSFVDYLRPAMRLSAMMKKRVIYILTHDSIGLGEDGPTHQPVEHLAIMRSTPNLLTFRPADQVETAECWLAALESKNTPSALCLSRQNLPTHRKISREENLCAHGGYVLADPAGELDGIFIATGSEVKIAMEAHSKLAKEGILTRVVSMPCWELFDKQSEEYKEGVLPTNITARVGIEAASEFGWSEYLGSKGIFIGMKGFGDSAPAEKLYEHFGITTQNAINTMKKFIN